MTQHTVEVSHIAPLHDWNVTVKFGQSFRVISR